MKCQLSGFVLDRRGMRCMFCQKICFCKRTLNLTVCECDVIRTRFWEKKVTRQCTHPKNVQDLIAVSGFSCTFMFFCFLLLFFCTVYKIVRIFFLVYVLFISVLVLCNSFISEYLSLLSRVLVNRIWQWMILPSVLNCFWHYMICRHR